MKATISNNPQHQNGNPPKKSDENKCVLAFCTSSATIAVLLLRMVSLLPREWLPFGVLANAGKSSSVLSWILHSAELAPIWTSTLIRPFETWDHVREARAIRQLFGTQFRDVYRGSYIHLPPLVLATLEPILDVPGSDFVIGLGTHLVDLMIAIKLLQLGKLVLEELRDPWEDALQARVPESLRPPLAHVFALDNSPIDYTNELPATAPASSAENSAQDQKGTSKDNDESAADDPSGAAESNDNPQTEAFSACLFNATPDFISSDLPLLTAQAYFYSPLTALASGIGSTHHSFQNIWLLLLLQSLHEGCSPQSSTSTSAFWLALASYMECHYWAFLIPLALFLQRRQRAITAAAKSGESQSSSSNGTSQAQSLLFFYVLWSLCLQGLSVLLVGTSQYTAMMQSSFGHVFLWKHLHPNFSVLWYLNMELFERYRVYFAILIGGLPYLLLAPVTIRLHRYPMELVTITWMLWTMIRPTTTLVDVNVACCLALLCPRSLARMRTGTTLVPAFSIPVPITLYVVTLWMWLETGQGEANFTFFQCLAYCAFVSTLCLEFCGASIRRDKVLRLTEKLLSKKQQKREIEERAGDGEKVVGVGDDDGVAS